MNNTKFRIGDKVVITSGDHSGETYVVIIAQESVEDISRATHTYRLRSLDGTSSINMDEEFLEFVPRADTNMGQDFFESFLKPKIDLNNIEPKFKIGDVVRFGTRLFVINEACIADNELVDKVTYEVTPLDDEFQTFHYQESALEFQYHDNNLAYYYTEVVGNGLPTWRGKLYNVYKFCPNDLTTLTSLINSYQDYDDDTLPVERMAHSIRGHSVYSRIHVLIMDTDSKNSDFVNSNRERIMEALGIDDNELDKLANSVQDKIRSMNRTDTLPAYTDKHNKRETAFTAQEYRFVQEIDEIDQDDHYPVDMTNLQIMDAIREAYGTARSNGKRTFPTKEKDRKSLPARNKGKLLYCGMSSKYDLLIEFWYNFDLNIIETAYPIRKEKHPKRFS